MSDPKRWLETDAPPRVRDLLQAGVATPGIDQEMRGRLGQYVAKAALPKVGGSLAAAKVIASVGIASVVGLAAMKLAARHPAHVEATPAEAAPAPPEPPPAPEQGLAAAAPVARTEPTEAKAPRRAAPRESAPPVSEVEYIEKARSLLARDAAEALRLANQRAEKFPLGRLGPEAEMVAVQALERLGQTDAAKARAERALARFPGSIYADSWRRRVESPR